MHSFFQLDITISLSINLFWQSRVFLEEILKISWNVTMKVSLNKMHLWVQFFLKPISYTFNRKYSLMN
jgi:hypothetical protein